MAKKILFKVKWLSKFIGAMCFLLLFIGSLGMAYYGLVHKKTLNDNSFINTIALTTFILSGIGTVDSFFKAIDPIKQTFKGKMKCQHCQNEVEIVLEEE